MEERTSPSIGIHAFAANTLYGPLVVVYCLESVLRWVFLFFRDSAKEKQRKPPRERPYVEQFRDVTSDDSGEETVRDISTQTDESSRLVEEELTVLTERIAALELQVKSLEQELAEQKFRPFNIVDNDSKVTFYTGFPS